MATFFINPPILVLSDTIQDDGGNVPAADGSFVSAPSAVENPTCQSLYVAANVSLINTSIHSHTYAIEMAGACNIDIEGSVSGESGIYGFDSAYSGYVSAFDSIYIGATGSVTAVGGNTIDLEQDKYGDVNLINDGRIVCDSTTAGSAAVTIYSYNFNVTNNGQIISDSIGVAVNSEEWSGLLTNNGLISGHGNVTVYATFSDWIVNNGEIQGNVWLGSGATLYDTGEIDGCVSANPFTFNIENLTITSSGKVINSAKDNDIRFTPSIFNGDDAIEIFGNYNISNAGLIEMTNISYAVGVCVYGGTGTLINSGNISGLACGVAVGGIQGLPSQNQGDYSDTLHLFNSGTISGDDAIASVDRVGNYQIVNTGTLTGGTGADDYAIYLTATSGTARVVNSGVINGDVSLTDTKATLVNSGTVHGSVNFGEGGARLVNSGTIDGTITFSGDSNVFLGQGGSTSFSHAIVGSGADSRYYAGAGFETFDLTKDGAALVVGGTGYAFLNYGASFNNSMVVKGGSGYTAVNLNGDYTGVNQIVLGAGNFNNVEAINLGQGHDYSFVVTGNGSSSSMETLNAQGLVAAQTFRFDASQNGGETFLLELGAGRNVITASTASFAAGDYLVSGPQNADTILAFSTAGTVLANAFNQAVGFSLIRLAAGVNVLQLADNLVDFAYNQTLTVKLKTGPDTIDDSRVITSTNTVISNATMATGDDNFIFGAAHDIVTLGASNSNSANYDTITNFDFANDSLRVQGFAPHAIDGSVFGSLSSASFDADLSAALAGHLHSSDALLFTATSGGLAGETFLVAATNGSDGYAAGDLVVKLTGSISGALTTANV